MHQWDALARAAHLPEMRRPGRLYVPSLSLFLLSLSSLYLSLFFSPIFTGVPACGSRGRQHCMREWDALARAAHLPEMRRRGSLYVLSISFLLASCFDNTPPPPLSLLLVHALSSSSPRFCLRSPRLLRAPFPSPSPPPMFTHGPPRRAAPPTHRKRKGTSSP